MTAGPEASNSGVILNATSSFLNLFDLTVFASGSFSSFRMTFHSLPKVSPVPRISLPWLRWLRADPELYLVWGPKYITSKSDLS
jgi:hypothetical protein